MSRNMLISGFGLACALLAGWGVFPRELYVQRREPLEFSHKLHAEKSGVADCNQCHAFRDDGTFVGVPPLETCAACHSAQMGASRDEAALVDNYVKPGKPVAWVKHAQQPANVWFSHAIHVKRGGLACKDCHASFGQSDQLPVIKQDRISGYSRDIMTMSQCEDCHRRHNIEASCLGCHK